MVFGIIIDVPLLVVPFAFMLIYRRRLVAVIVKTKLPRMALYLMLCVPLIVFEEQIDCMKEWCGRVIIPPTLPFLWVEMLALGALVAVLHARKSLRVTLLFSVYGIMFELVLGGLRGAPLPVILLLFPYVGLGYAFISMLPLAVLLDVGGEGGLKPPEGGGKGGQDVPNPADSWNQRSSRRVLGRNGHSSDLPSCCYSRS